MTDDFRRRTSSALTHPVTLAAVAVLLVNDLVLKALWPHPWTTGKLSDLAWMVFAPPLLAYLLSFAARENPRARRAAFGIAYIGLPLLYAAFNTFAPLHDWIMWGFSLVSGGVGSSPLDPYDSMVIPFSVVIALWVWRRGPVAPGGLRSRLGMITAGLAAFATVATSPNPLVQGITNVQSYSDAVYAVSSVHASPYDHYESKDGGLTWSTRDGGIQAFRPDSHAWLETPRGRYRIEGSSIVLSDTSGESVVYSTAHLRDSNNEWLQSKQTERWSGRELAFVPRAMTYDSHSGNLIVAMGIQGVVVGTPNGQWKPVAVGDFVPIDSLSSVRKAGYLMSSYNFWIAVLAFPMSMLALAFFFAHNRLRNPSPSGSPIFIGGPVAWVVMLFMVALSVVLLASIDFDPDRFDLGGVGQGSEMAGTLKFLIAVSVLFVGIGYLVSLWDRLRIQKFRAALGSYAAMVAFIILPFLAWLLLGISAWFATLAAIALCSITAFTLSRYLLRAGQQSATGDTPES